MKKGYLISFNNFAEYAEDEISFNLFLYLDKDKAIDMLFKLNSKEISEEEFTKILIENKYYNDEKCCSHAAFDIYDAINSELYPNATFYIKEFIIME